MTSSYTFTYGLGFLKAVDERDANYPMSLALPEAVTLPKYKYWTAGRVLNQGQHPHCVAYAWKQLLNSSPDRQALTLDPVKLYNLCQQNDEWPGEAYAGTSVRAGAKVLSQPEFGYMHIATYLWATNPMELMSWVGLKGPVVLGIPWDWDMYEPDKDGYIHEGGGEAGGHAITVVGYNSQGDYRLVNSWGTRWGQQGRCWIKADDLAHLIWGRWGEAVTAVEL